jgi:hypothetical protein
MSSFNKQISQRVVLISKVATRAKQTIPNQSNRRSTVK